METKELTARRTGRKSVFDNVGVLGYVQIDKSELSPEHEYHMVTIDGNCMDSDLSPIRVKDGDKILIHEIPLSEIGITASIGELVCFMLTNGQFYAKQAFFYDGVRNNIVFRMFNPQIELFTIPVNRIKALFMIDKVYSPEYAERHKVEATI